MYNEPTITINGQLLNSAQALVMRGALEIFASYLADYKEELGEIGPLYKLRVAEIRGMIFNRVAPLPARNPQIG